MFICLNRCMTLIDLKEISGLPIKLNSDKLIFSAPLKEVVPNIRTIEQMKEVLLYKSLTEPKELYFMYRGVCFDEDSAVIEENNLRYDITVIPALMLGNEFNKTAGHFHPLIPSSNLTFPEVYEVQHGVAHYLFQKNDSSEILLFEAEAGDKVVVPPNFGHVTINPGPECLVMANWVEKNFSSEYGLIKKSHGAMLFETLEGWIENKNYEKIPDLQKLSIKDYPEFGFFRGKPMYNLVKEIEKLDFLKNPAKYF